jgi:ABC-2 type transport system permease protein
MITTWKTTSSIFKRELGVYLGSPLAFVFLISFLLLCGIFTFTLGGFFERDDASLFAFFNWMPWLLIFLVPAVGMRLWSEEYRLGTIELLMTLPIDIWQAIVGKFLASWAFLCVALILTFPMVLTVNWLGSPDNGAILTGYFGCVLLAGNYLALACLASSITRNQVISFIVTVIACLLIILLGFSPVTDLLSRWISQESIQTLANFSFLSHFDGFQRGVIDSRDLLYFASTTVFYLYLSGIVIRKTSIR